MRHRTEILGIEIDNLDTGEFLERVEAFIEEGRARQIVYVNIHTHNLCNSDPGYARIVRNADLVYADGMGVVLASRLFSTPLKARVNAGDFLPEFCDRAVRRGYRVFILAGEPGVAEKAASDLAAAHPGLQVVGTHHGYFEENETPEIVARIREAAPHVLFVGMGSPRQEKWIHRNLDTLGVPVAWGVGALFDYYAGKTSRAPVWMRSLGLEWVHRLVLEPGRMWRRYLIGNVWFGLRAATLMVADVLSASVAWFAAYQLARYGKDREWWGNTTLNEPDYYLQAIPIILLLWIAICASTGLYRRLRDLSPLEELRSIVMTTIIYTVCASAIGFLLKEWDFGRSVVLLSAGFNFLLLCISRTTVRKVQDKFRIMDSGRHRTLIVGSGPTGISIRQRMEANPLVDHEIVGFVDDGRTDGKVAGLPVLGKIGELARLIDEHEVDEVFFANPRISNDEVLGTISAYQKGTNSREVTFKIAHEDMFRLISTRVNLEQVDNFPVVELKVMQPSMGYRVAKRLLDIFLSLILGSMFLLAFPFVYVAIRVTSPGPVIFRHDRVGRDGRILTMYKFRTMHRNVNEYEEAPITPNDQRVIPVVGKILRRTSLDELPQFINVLRGEMSMVGPRPEMPFLVNRYSDWQRMRLSVKPGITGLWQIIGRKDLPLYTNLEYDFYYIQNQSLMLDILILLKTIPCVLLGRGAY